MQKSCSGARTARDAHVSSATDRRPSRPTTTTATLRGRSLAPLASAVFCLECGLSTAYFLPLAHETQCSECDSGFREMVWCESCRTCTCYECWVSGALVASVTSTHPCAEPDPAQRTGVVWRRGGGVGRKGHPPPCVEFCGNMAEIRS